MRESAASKGRRYVAEGRLIVEAKHGDHVAARCRGAGTTWQLGFDPERHTWWCSCPARTTCSHLIALMLVVDVRDVP